jgi:hypothetical protein
MSNATKRGTPTSTKGGKLNSIEFIQPQSKAIQSDHRKRLAETSCAWKQQWTRGVPRLPPTRCSMAEGGNTADIDYCRLVAHVWGSLRSTERILLLVHMKYQLRERLFAVCDDGTLADLAVGTVITVLRNSPPDEMVVQWEGAPTGLIFTTDLYEHCVPMIDSSTKKPRSK